MKHIKKIGRFSFFRYLSVILVALLFVVSFRLDLQMLEGTLTGSRFMGFHMIDPFVSLEVLSTHGYLPVNFIIGSLSVLILYILLAGRVFCGWVCPYGLLSELGEKLHNKLLQKGYIKDHEIKSYYKYIVFVFFLLLSLISGALVFEVINPVGILSRVIVYGLSASVVMLAVIFIADVFIARRFWCRSLCPIGAFYGLINKISLLRIKYEPSLCNECGSCKKVCHSPTLLEVTAKKTCTYISGSDCTYCGKCIDVCPSKSLKFYHLIKKIV